MFPFSRFIISGHSMLPNLEPGKSVLSFNWAYFFSQPKVGDIVVFKKNTKEYIKRIEKINDYEVFVVGDNKEDSEDSRRFGAIQKKDILGKVVFVV